MFTLALLLALHTTPADEQARGTTTLPVSASAAEQCPQFHEGTKVVRVERCDVVDSGELAVVEGDRYSYRLYCIDVAGAPVPVCAEARGSRGVAVFVRRQGETRLRPVTTSFVISGEIRRPSIVANRYGHILELPTVVSATCECNASRYFLKRSSSRDWRELDFDKWQTELGPHLPAGVASMNAPWPDLANMRVGGALWRRDDAHCCPAGGTFSGELAIEGNRFVLRSVQVNPANEKP